MSDAGFEFHPMFPLGKDTTPYRKLTDKHVAEIDQLLAEKEKELMQV